MARVFPFILCCILAALGVVIWQARAKSSAFPEQFELKFTATGLVENVSSRGDTCTVKVAVYDWINLSQGFRLSEIPSRSERYYVRGQGETCQALTVAMASTEQHIGFEAGRSGKTWYFTKNPTSAVGCGGMKIHWLPDPES
jgi:hypothetical protein